MLRVESVPTLNLFDADDPLSMAIKPPPSESALEREARINAELEAKRISDLIDEEIKLGAKQRPNTEVKVCFTSPLTSSLPFSNTGPPISFGLMLCILRPVCCYYAASSVCDGDTGMSGSEPVTN